MATEAAVGPIAGQETVKLVTKKQIALRYSVATRTVDSWMSEHIIPYVKPSARCVRFDTTACDAALARFERVIKKT
ncbi:MAG: hypothetical protein EBS84_20950 [Proteobacteria bacterium]|nr:hypothetical protein [Verrucomicrobiota bacterium]NBU11445.1 hypothetical protein [Pseudomonadota bacterium]